MGLHGSDYLTEDVDIVYSAEPGNAGKLAALLTTVRARLLGRSERLTITPELLQTARFLNLSTDMGAVYVMREVPGVDSFEGLWERSVKIGIDNLVVRVASLDDLIAMKKAVNRAKDQLHLFELLALKKLRGGSETT